MSDNSKIEWTETTWNPTTGCDKISAGCDHCYALTLAKRLKGMGSAKYQNDGDPRTSGPGFGLTVHPDTLTDPLRWSKPKTVFVNSMSDLFHARVPQGFVARVFATMAMAPLHTFQILTKRPERMARILSAENFWRSVGSFGRGIALDRVAGRYPAAGPMALTEGSSADGFWEAARPLRGVWLGTSIESDEHVGRADHLRRVPAAVEFISAEPLLGPLPSLDLTGIHWLIIGGESGSGARPMDLGWVRDLIAMGRESGTAIFVKQLGAVWAGGGKGGNWDEWPADLRIREYPQAVSHV